MKSLPSGFFLIGLIASHLATSITSADPPDTSLDKIILLSNAQVLHGKVTLYGDRYLITQPHSELRIPVEQIERICHDLDEAYLHLKHGIRFDTATDHLRLAQWCLDENLRDCAQAQLDSAIAKQPNHPRISLIHRQLQSHDVQSDNPSASFEQPSLSSEDLKVLIHKLPEGAVESFTQMVQPVLMNGCSARACHGVAGNNDFLLHRFAHRQSIPRRITLRNLHGVTKWIDRERPEASDLLHYATTAHGDKKERANQKPPLAAQGVPFQRLSKWVATFHNEKLPKTMNQLATHSLAGTTPADKSIRTGNALSLHNRSRSQRKEKIETLSTQPAFGPEESTRFSPKDPFDPEIFNRRHHPSRK